MKHYCIVEKRHPEMHAGAKARDDAAALLMNEGWEPITVRDIRRKSSIQDKLRMCLIMVLDWSRILVKVERGSILLLQYPLNMYPKVSRIALPYLDALKKKKVRLIYLVHDLDSLRGINIDTEKAFLKRADGLIVHNEQMQEYVEGLELGKKKYRLLRLFDYLTSVDDHFDDINKQQRAYSVAIAGNLKKEKAGYVYRLSEIGEGIRFALYGPNFQSEKCSRECSDSISSRISYYGSIDPDLLPEKLNADFGLVWDGDELDSCTGTFGNYLRFNAPHKASLYLACGMPVIVWNESALAGFVKDEGIGIAVSSLNELPDVLKEMSGQTFQKLKMNARRVGKKVRSGYYLKHCIRINKEI